MGHTIMSEVPKKTVLKNSVAHTNQSDRLYQLYMWELKPVWVKN